MFQFYFIFHMEFNKVLKELIKSKCIFITETYDNIDNILYLDPNINYYFFNKLKKLNKLNRLNILIH
jgi:hypothetical protein